MPASGPFSVHQTAGLLAYTTLNVCPAPSHQKQVCTGTGDPPQTNKKMQIGAMFSSL